MVEIVETIIIGGGISGLSCGRKLYDNGDKDFVILTKQLGGRMLSSKNFCVDYGAAYVTSDYKNVLRYVEKREKLKINEFHFIVDSEIIKPLSLKNFKYIPGLLKLFYHASVLRKHLLKYRKDAEHKTVKELFEQNKTLMYYWNTPATEFIKKHNLEKIDEFFGNPVTATTAFTESKNVNTMYFLGMFFCAILPSWIVEFKHTTKKLSKGFEDNIQICSVSKVAKKKDKFLVKTSKKNYLANYVVFAAPQHNLKKVYNLPKPFNQQPAYTFHVVGRRKDIYDHKKAICFSPSHHDVYMLWKQKNGADLVYSKHGKPNFKEYYEKYHVVKKVHWHPGMIIPRGSLIDQNLDENAWLASDYNVSLLEDSFLTGVYAANQILRKRAEK